jgi:hypothetical protein
MIFIHDGEYSRRMARHALGGVKSFMKTEGAKYETTESTEEFLGKSRVP